VRLGADAPCVGPRSRCDTDAMSHENLLDGPAPTLLPAEGADADARAALASGATLQAAAAAAPSASLPWALLAEHALGDTGEPVAAYAYARTGYHRGLDALRRAGWRGRGPIPADHLPNQGFLRALLALAEAADAIGEQDEADRCAQFLVDSGTSSEQVAGLR
jgi:hypothetical protein